MSLMSENNRVTSNPGGCECMSCGVIFIGGPDHDECAKCFQSAKSRCLKEWETVNDPPCHPSDADWKPCPLCAQKPDEGKP